MTLRRHSWTDHWMVAQAMVALALAKGAARILPFRVIVRVLGLRRGASSITYDQSRATLAERIGWATRTAAARMPWRSTCLVQALAAAGLLRLHHVPGRLSFGVDNGVSRREGVHAHAWLEHGMLVVTGERERDRFTELASFEVASR